MIDLQQIFVPTAPLLESVARGSIMYLSLFVILRIAPTRQMGELSAADLLVIVLIADVSQNAFSAETRSIPEGLTLVVTIITWNYLLDWLAFRFSILERLLQHPPITLIKKGRVQWHNLRRENISQKELLSHLREQGVDSVCAVELARIEPDGKISVVRAGATQSLRRAVCRRIAALFGTDRRG